VENLNEPCPRAQLTGHRSAALRGALANTLPAGSVNGSGNFTGCDFCRSTAVAPLQNRLQSLREQLQKVVYPGHHRRWRLKRGSIE